MMRLLRGLNYLFIKKFSYIDKKQLIRLIWVILLQRISIIMIRLWRIFLRQISTIDWSDYGGLIFSYLLNVYFDLFNQWFTLKKLNTPILHYICYNFLKLLRIVSSIILPKILYPDFLKLRKIGVWILYVQN